MKMDLREIAVRMDLRIMSNGGIWYEGVKTSGFIITRVS